MKTNETLIEQLLKRLLLGEKINQKRFLQISGSWRLAAVVYEITKRYPIHTSRGKINKNHMVEYYLEENEIKRIKNNGGVRFLRETPPSSEGESS